MRARIVALLGGIGAVALAACNSLLGIDDHSVAPDGGSSSDATAEGAAPEAGGMDATAQGDAFSPEGGAASTPEGGVDATAEASGDGPGASDGGLDGTAGEASSGCGSGCPVDHPTCSGGQCIVRGPTMVPLSPGSPLYIDSTEVTAGQYQQFLTAKNGNTSGQPAVCAWNTSYGNGVTLNAPTFPMTSVDWCDALAYCTWANKHLCGKIGGGPIPSADALTASVSQWFLACGGAGGSPHPTNDTCNSSGGFGPLVAVATYGDGGCQGTAAGAYDLEGNAAEWVDSCDSMDAGPMDTCYVLGGSIYDNKSYCTESYGTPRNTISDGFGFRCCGG